MQKFIYKCGLFFLPVALVFCPAWFHLERHREVESVIAMTKMSQANKILIGLAYTDPMHLVKHEVLKTRQPQIIALGTSRVMQIRASFFNQHQKFYNCGRSVGKIQDLNAFMYSYPGTKPEMIVLGLDQDFFNVDAEDLSSLSRTYSYEDSAYGTRLTKGTKALFKAFLDGAVKTGTVLTEATEYIGRNARLYQEGYREDGSYCYGRVLRQAGKKDDYEFSKTIRRIEKGKGRFAAARMINSEALSVLDDFLKICKNANIHVVAFLPPYAGKIYDRFRQDSQKYPYVFELHSQLEPLFSSHGFVCEDYSDIRSLGANDFETKDGFHGSEICYLKLLRKLSEKDARLAAFLDHAYINRSIAGAFSARQILEEVSESAPQEPIRELGRR